jgi:hypothetical protein
VGQGDTELELERLIDAMFHSVWRDALGAGLRSNTSRRSPDPAEYVVASTLSVRGERSLDVRLECPHSTATALAAAFLRKPANQIAHAELQSVVDELANILAGNLKGALPGRNELQWVAAEARDGVQATLRGAVRRELEFGGWPCVLLVSVARDGA